MRGWRSLSKVSTVAWTSGADVGLDERGSRPRASSGRSFRRCWSWSPNPVVSIDGSQDWQSVLVDPETESGRHGRPLCPFEAD
jgi:hypothetical protein